MVLPPPSRFCTTAASTMTRTMATVTVTETATATAMTHRTRMRRLVGCPPKRGILTTATTATTATAAATATRSTNHRRRLRTGVAIMRASPIQMTATRSTRRRTNVRTSTSTTMSTAPLWKTRSVTATATTTTMPAKLDDHNHKHNCNIRWLPPAPPGRPPPPPPPIRWNENHYHNYNYNKTTFLPLSTTTSVFSDLWFDSTEDDNHNENYNEIDDDDNDDDGSGAYDAPNGQDDDNDDDNQHERISAGVTSGSMFSCGDDGGGGWHGNWNWNWIWIWNTPSSRFWNSDRHPHSSSLAYGYPSHPSNINGKDSHFSSSARWFSSFSAGGGGTTTTTTTKKKKKTLEEWFDELPDDPDDSNLESTSTATTARAGRQRKRRAFSPATALESQERKRKEEERREAQQAKKKMKKKQSQNKTTRQNATAEPQEDEEPEDESLYYYGTEENEQYYGRNEIDRTDPDDTAMTMTKQKKMNKKQKHHHMFPADAEQHPPLNNNNLDHHLAEETSHSPTASSSSWRARQPPPLVKVAILGPPNAGKSTLYNRLLDKTINKTYRLKTEKVAKNKKEKSKRQRRYTNRKLSGRFSVHPTLRKQYQSGLAIVSDIPGTTRDRRQGIGRIGGVYFELMDTAGIDGERLDYFYQRKKFTHLEQQPESSQEEHVYLHKKKQPPRQKNSGAFSVKSNNNKNQQQQRLQTQPLGFDDDDDDGDYDYEGHGRRGRNNNSHKKKKKQKQGIYHDPNFGTVQGLDNVDERRRPVGHSHGQKKKKKNLTNTFSGKNNAAMTPRDILRPMVQQAYEAAQEADLILFLFDAKVGITTDFFETCKWLRRTQTVPLLDEHSNNSDKNKDNHHHQPAWETSISTSSTDIHPLLSPEYRQQQKQRQQQQQQNQRKRRVVVLANKLEGDHWQYNTDGEGHSQDSPVWDHIQDAMNAGFGNVLPISALQGDGMADLATIIHDVQQSVVEEYNQQVKQQDEERKRLQQQQFEQQQETLLADDIVVSQQQPEDNDQEFSDEELQTLLDNDDDDGDEFYNPKEDNDNKLVEEDGDDDGDKVFLLNRDELDLSVLDHKKPPLNDNDENEEGETENEPFTGHTYETLRNRHAGDQPLQIAVLGRVNVGKSTLVNALLQKDRMITGPMPGLTRDSIAIEWSYKGRPVQLVDTAGLRKPSKRTDEAIEEMAVMDAIRAMKIAHVAVLVLDAEAYKLLRHELAICETVIREGRALVVAANKMDLICNEQTKVTPKDYQQGVQRQLARRFPSLRHTPVLPMSALTGDGVSNLMPVVFHARERWSQTIKTGKLNKWLREVVDEHAPPLTQGRPTKLKYMVQTKGRPPTFLIFCNVPSLPEPYLRYLNRQFQESFDYYGMDVRLLVRPSALTNPFDTRKARRGFGLGGREYRIKRNFERFKRLGKGQQKFKKRKRKQYQQSRY